MDNAIYTSTTQSFKFVLDVLRAELQAHQIVLFGWDGEQYFLEQSSNHFEVGQNFLNRVEVENSIEQMIQKSQPQVGSDLEIGAWLGSNLDEKFRDFNLRYLSLPIRNNRQELRTLGCLSLIFSDPIELSKEQIKILQIGYQLIMMSYIIDRNSRNANTEQNRAKIERELLSGAFIGRLKILAELSAGIAHEISNPLSIIQARSDQMIGIAKTDQTQRQEFLKMSQEIQESTLRINKIIKGVRAIASSGENDSFDLTKLDRLVKSTIEFCAKKIKDNTVEMKIKPYPVDFNVECREVQVTQALLNLIFNAVDAIKNLKEKWIEFEIVIDQSWAQFSVTDCGTGIGEGKIEDIFDSFYTTKAGDQGLGLGLAISRRIAQNHGGDLTVDKNCKNTRFVFKIPTRRASL